MKAYRVIITWLVVSFSANVFAEDNTVTEITALIQAVESSNCLFHRNGSTHQAIAAADHLRMKLKRGARYAKNTESFIDKLASKSYLSGKDYLIECAPGNTQRMKTWLDLQLAQIRLEE